MASKRRKKVINQLAGQHAHGMIDGYPPYDPMRQQNSLIPTNAHIDIVPRNLSQAKLLVALENPNNHVVISLGYAGTGKTAVCTRFALKQLVEEQIDKIIITRPTIESGESLGFLPGDINEKMAPWVLPIFDIITDGTGITKVGIEKMIRHGIIEIAPLQFIRGRAEPLTSMIPTPDGYKMMKDIKVGDYVFGSDGKPTLVTGVFPQGKKKMAIVNFSDGSSVKCSLDHLWNTRSLFNRYKKLGFKTLTTEEIQKNLKTKTGSRKHEIPIVSSAVEFNEQQVSIDPYLLGCLIGDGSISDGSIGFTSVDQEIVDEIANRLPDGVTIKKIEYAKNNCDYRISKELGRRNVLKDDLRSLELWGKTSKDKFIPEQYLFNSSSVRLEILRGLMDTDGSVFFNKNGKSRQQFYSVSEKLANNVKWLIESLGGIARLNLRIQPKNGTHKSGFGHKHDNYVVDFILPETINPFKLTRKAERYKPVNMLRLIDSIDNVEDEECQCISVAANDHLYLTNNFVVTHNTFKNTVIIADEMQNSDIHQLKLLLTRIGENSKILITGDLDQSDRAKHKGKSGLEDFVDRVTFHKGDTSGIHIMKFEKKDIVRHEIIGKILEIYQD